MIVTGSVCLCCGSFGCIFNQGYAQNIIGATKFVFGVLQDVSLIFKRALALVIGSLLRVIVCMFCARVYVCVCVLGGGGRGRRVLLYVI